MGKHKKPKLYLFAALLVGVILVSGCAGGSQAPTGLGNGVSILEFRSNQEGAQLRSNEPVQFTARIQNQGTIKAKNLKVNVVELLDKDRWSGITEQFLGDLTGFNQEQNLPGPVRTITFSSRTPQFGVQQTVQPKLSVKYDNVLKGTGTITLVDTDTFIQRKDSGKGLVTEFGTSDAGPLQIQMEVPEVRTTTQGSTYDLLVPVHIVITDKLGVPATGHVTQGLAQSQDYTYPVRVNIRWPSRLSLDFTGSDPLCQNGVINLNQGKSYDTTCILRVTNPPQRGAAAEKVSFEVELQYTYEVLQSLSQPITVLKTSTGF